MASPLPPGSLAGTVAWLPILFLAWFGAPLHAQTAPRSTPGLVLASDGRTAACDALTFTPDGLHLLATGDDKVVRRWIVDEQAFSSRKLAPLRWPIYREQRGCIFALALSPLPGDSVAIGGFGLRTGSVCVLNRSTGAVEHSLSRVGSRHATWAIAFSPSGKHVVHGTGAGEVYVWNIGAGEKTARRLPDSGGRGLNLVRLLAFLSADTDETRFVCVTQDGKVRLGDAARPSAPLRTTEVAFELPHLYRVSISPGRRWLAATGEWAPGARTKNLERVELIDLRKALAGEDSRWSVQMPRDASRYFVPHSLAFDSKGKRLAVGCRVHPHPPGNFYRETGGRVFLFDLGTRKRLPADLDLGYRPDALAFRPTPKGSPPAWRDQLASAGGNDHEVRLWNVAGTGKRLDVLQGPGSCLWSVALGQPDRDGKIRYLAWKEKRAELPASPNDWGARGDREWRVFDRENKVILPHTPADFKPVRPLATFTRKGDDEEWRVVTTADPYLWRVVGPGDTDMPLDAASGRYLPSVNNMPRCWTFIPDPTGKKPVRLAVGHTWGISVYQCERGKVTLARVMYGHEGEVMSVAPSHDGRLLVSASRDHTLACWGLVDWPTQAELGATFQKSRDGKLVVREVSPGSPAWEPLNPLTGADEDKCRLAEGDEIDMLLVAAEKFLYDPRQRAQEKSMRGHFPGIERMKARGIEEALDKLAHVRPNQEYVFVKRVDGKDVFKLTSVRQRPLWRFFPERRPGKDWVIWRYRDFYYDTNSARADSYVGWQVNRGADEKPDFFPLERFRGEHGFHQPKKVWAYFDQALGAPEKVIFPDLQPPEVKLAIVARPDKTRDLVVRLSIRPTSATPAQKLGRVVNLWLNEYKYPVALKPNEKGIIEVPRLAIKRSELRHGRNRLTLQAYNAEGGRGQDVLEVEYKPGGRPVRTLWGLCVGINDYTRVKGYTFADLRCSKNDAEEMREVLEQHGISELYREARVKLVPQEKATAAQIRARLRELGAKARPDDWLVLFLSGHGYARMRSADDYEPGSFFYLCADSDRRKPSTQLSSKDLYDALTKIRCSKLVILDCCHSGDVKEYVTPLRALSREGVPFLILSSCKINQSSYEPRKGKHGLFTQSLLEAIGDASSGKGKKRANPLTGKEVGDALARRLAILLEKYGLDSEDQTPEFLIDSGDEVLCKP